jgi:hypothetical protein
MSRPTEQNVDTLQSLIGVLEELASEGQKTGHRWVYRGQSHSSWPLSPSIERRIPNESIRSTEGHLLWDFRRLATSLSDRLPEFNDAPSWLALMRHYGVPTRLLDWTDSAYVALYFASHDAERPSYDPDQYCSVWALDASLALEAMQAKLPDIAPISVVGNDLDLSSKEHFENVALYAFDGDVNKNEGLVAELPARWSNSRMAFQQGTFMINCNHQLDFAVSLQRMMAGHPTNDWLRKIAFPCSLSQDISRYLYERNVHPFTLFPDLDGLGCLLRMKNNVYWSRQRLS